MYITDKLNNLIPLKLLKCHIQFIHFRKERKKK